MRPKLRTPLVILAALAGFAVRPLAAQQIQDTTAVRIALAATTAWLEIVDGGKAGESWDAGAPAFQAAVTKADWIKALTSAREPFEPFGARTILSIKYIVAGSLWVGFIVFNAFLLGPAIQDAGPGAASIMPALARRRLMTILPALALVAILSGLWLFWLVSGTKLGAYLQTATGAALGLGAACALVAYVIGMLVARPSTLRAAALLQQVETLSAEARAQRLEEAARLRKRGTASSQLVGVLLLVATICMAVARYL